MLRAPIKLFTYLLLSCITISCARSSDGENLTEPLNCELPGSNYGIVGGNILSSGNELSSSTVMVINLNYKDDVSICTGTLIDTDKVLTAAHCISPYGGKSAIAFTNNLDCASQATQRTLRPVINSVAHEEYSYLRKSLNNASYDLAILKFKGPLPDGYKVRPLPAADFAPAPTDTLVTSGYGVTSEENEDSGVLRFSTSPGTKLLKNFYLNLLKKVVSIENTWVLEQYENGVCSGDSGGPLYADTKDGLILMGVTSTGVDNRAHREVDVKSCHGVALFTDLRPHLNWIIKNINSL